MSQDIQQHLKADMDAIPATEAEGLEGLSRLRALVAHAFLRIWTRLALDTGEKLKLSPSQYHIGTYKGKMNWILNEGGLDGINRLEIAGAHDKDYAFVGEIYELDGVARARILFSFQEDEVKGKPVFVSYLVYDESVEDFNYGALADTLAPAMPEWTQTMAAKSKEPLWTYSKEHFECVGM